MKKPTKIKKTSKKAPKDWLIVKTPSNVLEASEMLRRAASIADDVSNYLECIGFEKAMVQLDTGTDNIEDMAQLFEEMSGVA